ncbi:hypothetical protein GCM10011608_46300 [Micromonospora sonchi]|uniref:Uncharacterized protein n=1 Tax=Micromonospora sonchi TaxID=1763543 RepID=A0A917U6C7_9ACTN|nr:hypothetical protein [Micromonospora sonchi]GGM56199.1 hypothetical protein GCM10011608_46300 [Micromonospora sonchi]
MVAPVHDVVQDAGQPTGWEIGSEDAFGLAAADQVVDSLCGFRVEFLHASGGQRCLCRLEDGA